MRGRGRDVGSVDGDADGGGDGCGGGGDVGGVDGVDDDAVAVAANAIDTLDCLIASKKKTQCAAIIKPTPMVFSIPMRFILKLFFITTKYTANEQVAKNMRYQTNCSEGMVISFPKIAVNPKMSTTKCKSRRFFI